MINNAYGARRTLNVVFDDYPKGLQLRRNTSISLPVSLDEAKDFLRVVHDNDDNYITMLIKAMTWRIEDKAEIALSTQSITAEWAVAQSYVTLPRPPFVSVSGIAYFNDANVEVPITASGYYVEGLTIATIRFKQTVGKRLRVTYTAGYGSATDIPDDLKQYILQLVFQEYNQRGSVTDDMIQTVAENFKSFFFV
jgi:uncharacterized phiE125 gp8 family phage protein